MLAVGVGPWRLNCLTARSELFRCMTARVLVEKEGLDWCSKRGFTGLYIGSSTLVKQGVKSGNLGY
jgi:hypothetical protein